MLEYNHGFAADFDLALSKVEDNLLAKQRTIWISVKNNGTLMDTGKVEKCMSTVGKREIKYIMNLLREKKN